MSDLPPPPPGFVIQGGAAPVPPPPPGFVLRPHHTAPVNPMMASPKAGRLPPAEPAAPDDMGAGAAYVMGAVKGVPVAGPPTMDWIQDLVSRFGADPKAEPGQPGSKEELQAINALREHDTEEAHPLAAGAGELTGGIGGYGTAAMVAPELFGAGAASLPVRAGISAATNAGIAGGDTAVRGGNPADIGKSAAIGGALGAAAPVAGKIIGAGVRPVTRMFSNFFGPGVPGMRKSAANALADALTSDSAVSNPVQTLQRMGPEGSLADVGPATQGWAQGVTALKATPGGQGRSLVFNALKQRDEAAPQRVLGTLDTEFGPVGNSPLKEQQLNRDQARIEGQALPNIFRTAPQVDASQPLATIGVKLNKAVGPEQSALKAAQAYIQKAGRTGIGDAQTLHNAKEAIQGLIDYGDQSLGIPPGSVNKAQGALKLVAGQLNKALRDQIPGYADTMDKLSALREEAKQIKAGNEIFKGGNEPVHPQDLAAELAGLTPEQQAAKRFGARAAIDRRIRTSPNDRLALKGVVGDPEDFKRQNLSAIFGGPQTENVANRAEAERTMFGTKHNVMDNSQTEPRQEAVKMANPEAASHGIGVGVAAIHPAAIAPYAGLKGAEASIKAANRAFTRARNMDIARALLPRSDAASLAQSLLAHGARREVAGQSTAKAASDLARALTGYEGTVRKGQDRPSLDTIKKAAAIGVGVPLAIWQNLP